MKTLTIFTPAYNRAHTIGRTYRSLLRQTCQDFEWLVIDDGSSDNTRDLVESWIAEKKIPIRYIRQENQGMHGAHNTAYQNIFTELNTCIDSDDFMPDDAVEKIIRFWNSISEDKKKKYAGIIGLDQTVDGKIIGSKFTTQETTTWEFYAHGGYGDKKLVYRSDIIRQFPLYPIFKGEKYVSLGSLYTLIDQKYKVLTLNEPLVVVEYQPDGSSYNMYSQYIRNPHGFIYNRKLMLSFQGLPYKLYLKHGIHYVAEKFIAHEGRTILTDTPKPFLCSLLLFPGYLLFQFIKYKERRRSMVKITY